MAIVRCFCLYLSPSFNPSLCRISKWWVLSSSCPLSPSLTSLSPFSGPSPIQLWPWECCLMWYCSSSSSSTEAVFIKPSHAIIQRFVTKMTIQLRVSCSCSSSCCSCSSSIVITLHVSGWWHCIKLILNLVQLRFVVVTVVVVSAVVVVACVRVILHKIYSELGAAKICSSNGSCSISCSSSCMCQGDGTGLSLFWTWYN